MKNMVKKIVGMCVASAIIFSMSVPAFAAGTFVSQDELREKVVQIVANATSVEERDAMLSELLEENPLAPETSLQAANSTDDNSVCINGMPKIVESVEIDDTKRVDFFETGEFGIYEIEDLGAPDVAAPMASTYKYTNTYRTYYTIKNILGGKIVETFVKGYFKYNGSSIPTAYLEDAGYDMGTLIFWDCSSWEEDTGTNYRDRVAYCYADAYYDWTLDISFGGSAGGDIGGVEGEVSDEVGGGLTIQDCNVFLKLNCKKDGSVYGSVSVDG